jgi:hypothetical protein
MDRSTRLGARFAALLVPLALLVAACGGGGSTSGIASRATTSASTPAIHPATPDSRTPDSTTQAAGASGGARQTSDGAGFTSAADAICQRLKSEVHTERSQSLEEVIRVAPQNETLEQRALSELSKLTPPRARAGQWAQFLAVRGSLAHQLGTLAVAGKRYEARALEELRAAKPRAHDARQLQELLAAKAHAQGNALGRVVAAKKRAHGLLRVVATNLGLNTCARVG